MSVVLPLRGVTALSDFRVEKLLQKARVLNYFVLLVLIIF